MVLTLRSSFISKLECIQKSSWPSQLACANIGNLQLLLEGLCNVNTWSHFGYVLKDALFLSLLNVRHSIYRLPVVEQIL